MNKQKKILILGAGVYQVPLIKCARKLGIYSIVASIPGNYPGFALADKVYLANTVDTAAILEIAKNEQVDGVCLAGTDVAVITLGTVCDELHLVGVSKNAAKLATNKSLMKDAFLEHSVSTASFVHVNVTQNAHEVATLCERIGYPVIFKAVDASGSRGIIRVDSESEIANAIEYVKAATRTDEYLVEKYLVGVEFGAQAFIFNGKVQFVVPHGDDVFMGATGVPVGHFAPCDIDVSDEVVTREAQKAIHAMGIDNCAVNIDFILADGVVYVLEVGARAGATCLAELVSLYYGYNYYEKILCVALGETVDFTPQNKLRVPNASRLITCDKSGIVKSITIDIPEECKAQIADIAIDCTVGDTVRKFAVGPDRVGHVIATGDTLQSARNAAALALTGIRIEVE